MIEIPSSGPAGDMHFSDIFDMDSPPRPNIPDGPIIVAVARDEMARLPDYLRHHRAIGIRHFLIVDNGSTDGSSEYLDAQPDVTRFFSTGHFPTFKQVFRPWLADRYGDGRWVLAPDLDEHFVYPGWPNIRLDSLLDHWDRQGFEAVFAPMVDMYSDDPLCEISTGPDARLVEVYPLFDAEGYWIAPPKPSTMKRSPTPPMILFGGARTRLGRQATGHDPSDWLTRLLVRSFLDHRNHNHPAPGAWAVHRYFMQRRIRLGAGSKVPLIRWSRGIRFPGSNHRINATLSLAPDWAALLHFRLMSDYVDREAAWDARKSRESSDRIERYQNIAKLQLKWEGSCRLRDWRDLQRAGLIRASNALTRTLDL